VIGRLIFGCGHFTGGASQSQAQRVVKKCLDMGLRRFDTAPLYGIGTAEAALGSALRQDGRDALIQAKVGLPRPRHGVLKSYLRLTKRVVSNRSILLGEVSRPARSTDPSVPRGHFEFEQMRRSFTETLHALGQSCVQALFLHEAYADNISPEAIAFLRGAQARGEALELGVANSAVCEPSLAELVPADFWFQTAAPPEIFEGIRSDLSERCIFHTIVKSFSCKRATDRHFNAAVIACCRRFEKLLGTDQGAEIALSYFLIGAAAPQAKLIYATSHEGRLEAFLNSMHVVECGMAEGEIIEFFRESYGGRKVQKACFDHEIAR